MVNYIFQLFYRMDHLPNTDDGEPKQLVVEIANTAHQKPYLGGFRHKFSQVEYHNASVQTRPKLRAKSGVDYCCRDTQTVELSHCLLQTANNTSTQMTGGNVLPCTSKSIIPLTWLLLLHIVLL